MTAPVTIYTQEPGKYHVWKTVDGYVVVFIIDRHNYRNVDGGKVHKKRQNAWAKADHLNNPIKHALKKTGMAEAAYGSGYIANAQKDEGFDIDNEPYEYTLTLRQGAMPPFETKFFGSLDEIEQYAKQELPQPLTWKAVKPEQI